MRTLKALNAQKYVSTLPSQIEVPPDHSGARGLLGEAEHADCLPRPPEVSQPSYSQLKKKSL